MGFQTAAAEETGAAAQRLPGVSAPRCRVCGCDAVRTDVVDRGAARGALLLGECPRCDHRFTEALGGRHAAAVARPALRVLREGASAA